MITTIYLIRHGEVEFKYNKDGEKMIYGPNVHLSQSGIKQIKELAEIISKDETNITLLYSSPFERTIETAKILSNKLNIKKIIIEKELSDIYTKGQEKIPMRLLDSFHHQETINKLSIRIVRAINQILSFNQGKTFAIICHGDPIRVYVDKLFFPRNKTPDNSRDQYYLGKGEAWRLEFNEKKQLINHKLINLQKRIIL